MGGQKGKDSEGPRRRGDYVRGGVVCQCASNCSRKGGRLTLSELTLGDIGTVPPSAAQSLKQRGRVGITIRLGLHKVDQGLLIGLLRAQEGKVVGVAGFKLFLRQVEGDGGGIPASAAAFKASASCCSAFSVSATF